MYLSFYCLLTSSFSDPKQAEGWFLIFPTNFP